MPVRPPYFPGNLPEHCQRLAVLVSVLLWSSVATCPATIATWTGSGSAQTPSGGVFSNPGNWGGDVVPNFTETTDLVFDVGTSGYTATNDLGSLKVNSVQVSQDGNFGSELRLEGGAFAFERDGAENPQLMVSSTGDVVRIGSELVLGADLTLTRPAPSSGNFLYIGSGIAGGNVNLGSHNLHVTRPNSFIAADADRIRIGESGSTTRGVIQGTGKIVLEDLAITSFEELTLQLSSRNTYSGGTEVKSGQLALNGDTVVSNGVVQSGPVGTGPVTMNGGVLRSTVTRRTLYNDLIVNGSFALGDNGLQAVIVAGSIRLNGSYVISVAPNGFGTEQGVVEVSGSISESSPGTGLTWNLDQPLKLTSVCGYTGPTVVRANTLQLNAPGSLRNTPLTLTLKGGLSGDGETGSVTAESGTSISPGAGIGVLHTFGNVHLKSGSRLSLEIGSGVAALGYDQWNVQGTIELTDADLQIALAYDPVDFTDVFYVVKNDGTEAVSGFFSNLNGTPADLAEGSRFFVADQEFEITYSGEEGIGFAGAGNDIAIRALPEPSTIALLLLCGVGLINRRPRQAGV